MCERLSGRHRRKSEDRKREEDGVCAADGDSREDSLGKKEACLGRRLAAKEGGLPWREVRH
jgi:hypothetical protein